MIRKKGSSSVTIAWLLVIVFVPYVGVPLYVMFGGRKMRRRAGRKTDLGLQPMEAQPLAEAAMIDRLVRRYDIPGATFGNRLDLCQSGEEAYARLVELIEQAQKSVHVAMYIFYLDEVGRDIFDRLVRRAADGLDVRLLLDDLGSMSTKRRHLAPLAEAGGHFASFMPMLHWPWRGRANLRNHRKIVVADGQRVMAGGTNIASEYIGPTPIPGRWCDLAFIMEGPAAALYEEVFRSDWEFASSVPFDSPPEPSTPAAENGALLQVVPTGPDAPGDPLYDALLSAVFAARERLWVVSPYFIPDDSILMAMTLASHRGVDVRVCVPEHTDTRYMELARGPYLRDVQEAGGTIHLYTKGMMHAKVLLKDSDLAMIGSANMDMRSLFLNYEIATVAYSQAEIDAVEDWIERLMADSRTGVEGVGPFRDFWEGVLRMIAPLL
jgi:cardiolipin synthase A/B